MSDFEEMLNRSFDKLDEEITARKAQAESQATLAARIEQRHRDKLTETMRLGQEAVSQLVALHIPTRQVWATRRVGTGSVVVNTKSGSGRERYPQYTALRTAQGWHVLNVFALNSDGDRPQSPDRYGLDVNGHSFQITNHNPSADELNGETLAKNDLIAARSSDGKPYFESADYGYTILDEAFQIGIASLIRRRRPYDHFA